MSDGVRVSRSHGGRIAHIRLDRPEKSNALTPAGATAIRDKLREVQDDPSVLAVVLSAEGGRTFCGGYDLSGVIRGVRDDELQLMLRTLRELAVPTVAVVDGHAVGAGLDLACSCDLRIVRRGVRVGLPAVRIGVAYDAEGLWRILTVAPGARRLLLSGLLASAEATAGFADVVAEADTLAATVDETLDALVDASPAALSYMLRMTRPGAAQAYSRQEARAWRDAVLDGPDPDIAAQARLAGHAPAFPPREGVGSA